MTDVTIEAGTLTASREDRVVSGLLLPYGEQGRTNLGRFVVPRGAFQLPPDPQVLNANLDHKRDAPIARTLTMNDTDRGLFASWRVADGPEGDQLLEDIQAGRRRAVSVEATNVVIRAGRAVAGRIFGAAFCKAGAFPSATLMAADAGELPDDFPDYLLPTESSTESTEEIVVNGVTYVVKTTATHQTEVDPKAGEAEDDTEDDPTPQEDPSMSELTASAPADLTRPTRRRQSTPDGMTVRDVARLFATAAATRDPDALRAIDRLAGPAGQLFAALSDVKFDGTGGLSQTITTPQWIGELWSGKAFQRKIVPLFPHADLTSLVIKGWKWGTKPEMAPWTGNKTNVPSNSPTVQSEDVTANRLAGGHDIAREYRDFNVEGFWEGYFRAMTESYARLSDAGVLSDITAAATPVTRGTVPTGVDPGLVSIVDGALSFIDTATPSFAVVAKDVWRSILLTPKDKTLEYLTSAMGLEDGDLGGFRLLPSGDLDDGEVLVGAREAATVYELPGVPIRAEALDLVKGGIDEAMFGYYGTVIHDDTALALVTPPAAG